MLSQTIGLFTIVIVVSAPLHHVARNYYYYDIDYPELHNNIIIT